MTAHVRPVSVVESEALRERLALALWHDQRAAEERHTAKRWNGVSAVMRDQHLENARRLTRTAELLRGDSR